MAEQTVENQLKFYSLRDFIEESNDENLILNYNNCINELIKFRRGHKGLAKKYVVDKIPKEMHDVPVDLIVTEKRVVDCKFGQF